MNTDTVREIDRLVSEMHDDGLEGDGVRQLEKLLTDDPAAQTHYWQLVDTHFALTVAVSSNPLQTDSTQKRSASAPPASDSSVKGRALFFLFRHSWWLAAAAAVLLVGFFGALKLNWTGESRDISLPQVASQLPMRAFEQMPMITRVSWEGPSFATDSKVGQPAAMVSVGAITLRVNEGEVADGYLLCLMPGESVKLVATFDATGENSLSVVEITGDERAAVRKVTFHNSGTGPKPRHANPNAQNRRYGILGHWSETNTTEFPRHFLLTGVHKLAKPGPDESWRLSKIAVLVESDLVVHLGWDDSGPAPAEGQEYQEDYDYDDLAASLFFDRPSSKANFEQNDIQVMANQELPVAPLPSALDGGYVFELGPGSAAILKAASVATDLNAIVAIDAETQEVLWSSSKQSTQLTNLGAACLFNRAATAKQIRLIGINKPHGSNGPGIPWRVSSYETLYEQPGYLIIGFDDSLGDKDFDDVRVSVLITAATEPHIP